MNSLYFEQLGDQFDQFISDYDTEQRVKWIVNELKNLDPFQSTEILEIGSGTGRITRSLLSQNWKVKVSDISLKLVKSLVQDLKVDGEVLDVSSLQLDTDSVALIVSSECIEHSNPRIALREIVRVLRPGGYAIITTPNLTWYPLVWVTQKVGLRKFKGPEHFLSTRSVRTIVRSSGGRMVVRSGLHLFPWQIPGAKGILPRIDKYGKFLFPLMINQCIVIQKNG